MLAIVLLVVLASNLAGIFIFFEFQKWDIRNEIKQHIKQDIPDSELSIIAINAGNADSLEWFDETEFKYNGQLYDVVRTKITDDHQTIYYCISDTKETDLFASKADLINKIINSKKNCKQPVNNLFNLFSQLNLQPVEICFQPYLRHAGIERAAHIPYDSPYLLISSPPPKLV
jgi:hypothetical protein